MYCLNCVSSPSELNRRADSTVFVSSGAQTRHPTYGNGRAIVAEPSGTLEKFSGRATGIAIALSMVVGGAVAVATTAAAAPAKATGTKIALRHSPHGKVLDGAARKYVYVHVTASGKNVGCNAVCQAIWPMAKTTGKPRAAKGVKAKRLGQTSAHQVTYHGHPLFYYSPSPQNPSIDGAHSFQGNWRLISAKGKLR